MQSRKQRFLLWSVLMVVVAGGLSGCLKSNDTPQTKKTFIYLMHMAPQIPAVELYFNGTKTPNNPFGFGSVSGQYGASEPGVFDVKFKKGNSDSLIASVPAALYDSLRAYSLILWNDEQGRGHAMRIVDDFSNVNTSLDRTWYRFLHLAPDAGEVDFFIGDTKVSSLRRLADNGSGTYEEFISFAPGDYKITAKVAGTSTVLTTTTSEVSMAKAYVKTFVLRGLKAGTGTNALGISALTN